MKILLRYDDYSEISNIGVDLAVFEAMVSRGFKPLVGTSFEHEPRIFYSGSLRWNTR